MEHNVDAIVGKILDQGPIGIVCLILLGVLWVLWRTLREEQAAFRVLAAEATKGLSDSSKTIAAMGVAVENTNRLNEARLETLRNVQTEMEALNASVGRIEAEQRRVADRLGSSGGRH